MIYTAYMDESGTHDPSPVTIMAGAYGTAAQWKDVEARIKELEKKRQFSMFHSKDLKSGHGSFKDWSSEQRLELVQDFLTILVDQLIKAGFVMQIENEDYDKYYSFRDGPTSTVLDTKYGLCFRGCLTHLLELVKSREDTVNIVMEAGHKNSGDAARIFRQMKSALKAGCENLLGTLTLAAKKDCMLLGIADFLAYTSFMGDRFMREGKMQQVAGGQKANVVSLKMTPEQLATARQQLESIAGKSA
jgi:Protein of unknown function (DUF3800)